MDRSYIIMFTIAFKVTNLFVGYVILLLCWSARNVFCAVDVTVAPVVHVVCAHISMLCC